MANRTGKKPRPPVDAVPQRPQILIEPRERTRRSSRHQRILHRYVLREILGPLVLGLMLFTFLLLIDSLFALAALVIQRDVPMLMVGRLLLLNLPHIIVITLPMSLLFAILIAVGRLASDAELVALRASGVSLFSLYRPVFALSLVLATLTLYATLYVQPWGNRALRDLQVEIGNLGITKQIQPRVFYEQLRDRILYVFAAPERGDEWRGVFFTVALPIGDFTVTQAAHGSVSIDPRSGRSVLRLRDAVEYTVHLDEPKRSELRQHGTVAYTLEDELTGGGQARSPGVRELDLQTLLQRARDPAMSSRERRLAELEVHKKLAIPAACVVLGLFGLPLGFSNRRGGKSSGFALSLAVILAYYVLLNNGEAAAASGEMRPWTAMWLPNLLFLGAGLFLLARRNRDQSLLLGNLDRWVRTHARPPTQIRAAVARWSGRRLRRALEERSARSPSPRPDSAGVVLRLERPVLRFPNILDRYVLSSFGRIFVLVAASVMAIFMIGSFSRLVDDVLKSGVPASVVLDYYKYLSFDIFHRTAPLVVLLTCLISFGLLARANEVTAAKALGMSLYRLAIPALVAAGLVAGASAAIGSAVLPHSNARVAELRDEIRGTPKVRTYKRADEQWLFRGRGNHSFIYHYQYFDPRRQVLQRLHAFRFDAATYRLSGHLFAPEAVYRQGTWLLQDGWAKNLNGTLAEFVPLAGLHAIDLEEDPEFFSTEIKRPDQMNAKQLRQYIRTVRASGQDVPELEVELYNKAAVPAVCVIMALVALPFAFRLGRRGALYGIGVSLVLGMAYYVLIALFTTLGQTGTLPAMAAVWSPNLIFALLSLYLFLGIRT